MDKDFVARFKKTFDNGSMADVARRLGVPHATVRNYYQGVRLPASDVLIKIATETGVSLNWLLMGTGDMYGGTRPPIGLGKFLEEKIGEIIDQKISSLGREVVSELSTVDFREAFDVEAAVLRLDDPEKVMSEWFAHEGRKYPKDFGVVFFRGWETFSPVTKIAAVRDAKRVLDRSLP
jgi:transcriptional regulator with XRE-family HTH domain